MRWILVLSQFACSASLILTTNLAWELLPAGQLVWKGQLEWKGSSISMVLLAALGSGLAIAAWMTMGLRKLRITPDVAADASLVTSGPYRWIRHPMYSGLMLFCMAFLLADFRLWRAAILVGLAITLGLKARMEERLLIERFPDYNAYRARSWKFIPFLY